MIRRPVVIAGARPNFPKVAPLIRAMKAVGMHPMLVHTGQHYDAAMSASFFEALDIPDPVANLGVGSGSHAAQTAAVMVAIESWLQDANADAMLVVGDVNSTVACAIVAAKAGIPIGHVEAGLRSFDRSMPEEINRVVVDALATWLFTPSADADENLIAEGVEPERIHNVGNVMVDSLFYALPQATRRPTLTDLGLTRDAFGLVTLHRPALVDDADRLRQVARTLADVGKRVPLVFPVHPRTRQMIDRCEIHFDPTRVQLIAPLGYLDFLNLQESAAIVLTDSGGVQEETTVLGVPCLTLRDNTERPITVTRGTNRLVGFDHDAIVSAADEAISQGRRRTAIPLWDGRSCERIADILAHDTRRPAFIPSALTAQGSPEFKAGRAVVARMV